MLQVKDELCAVEEILLLILDNDNGEIRNRFPRHFRAVAFAGAALMDLALQNRIDTNADQLIVSEPTPLGDELLDPILAEIAQSGDNPRSTAFWIAHLARQSDQIREMALTRLIERGYLEADAGGQVYLSPGVSRIRRYTSRDGRTTEEVQLRIMRTLFSDDIPDPRDIVIISLAAASRVFESILSQDELAQVQGRIDLICRMDLIGREVTAAIRQVETVPRPAPPAARPPEQIPQAAGLPLFGNAFGMAGDLSAFLLQEYRQHGPIFRVRALNRRFIALVGPEANRFVERQGHIHLCSFETWRDFNAGASVMRTVLSMDGPEHLRLRKVLARGYSPRIIEGRLGDVVAITRRAIDEWPMGRAISAYSAFQQLVMEQIGLVLTGYSGQEYADDLILFLETMLMTRVRRQWPKQIDHWPPIRRARKRVMELYAELLASHRPEDRGSRDADFIDALMEAWREDPQFLPEIDLPMAALGPFVAGLDTSASVISYALHALLAHPELLEEVTTEVDGLFDRGPLSAQGLGALEVTHRVMLETLRIYPVIPGMIRIVSNSFDFEGYTVPAGARVLIGNTVTHHLPELFPDPQRFDVERYRRTPPEHHQPGAYAPFGVGRHRCLGSGFAETQIMATIATLVREAEFALERPNRPLKIKYAPTYHPSFKFRLVRRRGGEDRPHPQLEDAA